MQERESIIKFKIRIISNALFEMANICKYYQTLRELLSLITSYYCY